MKRATVWMAAALVAAGLCAGTTQAQMKSDGAKDAASGDLAAKSMDAILTIYEGEIIAAAEAMPADKFDFRPTQSYFAASSKVDFASPNPVMTFGEEVRHIAQANYHFFTTGSGMKADRDIKAIGELKNRDEILKALKDSYAFAHKAVLSTTPANAFNSIEMFGHATTPVATYAFGLAHMCDHYGQLVEYLRMNGIVPPASRPSNKKGD